jgi:hypothetical protein
MINKKQQSAGRKFRGRTSLFFAALLKQVQSIDYLPADVVGFLKFLKEYLINETKMAAISIESR